MTTWKNLPNILREVTTIYVYPDELQDYAAFPSVALPEGLHGIANKRQYMVETCDDDKLIILDDDLVFARRRKDDPTKFRPCTGEDLEQMWLDCFLALDHYAHGGIATREGGNRNTADYKFNTRAIRGHIFRTDVLKREGIKLNETKFMSDFDTTLQLLRRGYNNIVLNSWVTNQSGSNTEGGCSTTRTLSDLADAAHELHDRHPKFVKVVKKKTKSAWGGGERTDVVIQWKKAYESAPEKKYV